MSLRRPTRASAIAANQALVDDSPTSENPSSSDTESDLNKDGSDSDVSNLSSSGFDDSSDDNASTEVHDPTLDRESMCIFLVLFALLSYQMFLKCILRCKHILWNRLAKVFEKGRKRNSKIGHGY